MSEPLDNVGLLALAASHYGHIVQFNLLAVASPTLPAAKRLEAMERVFMAWAPLCREMKRLEEAAPRTSAAGLERAARLADFAERHRTPPAEREGSRDAV